MGTIIPYCQKLWENNLQIIKEKMAKAIMFFVIFILCLSVLVVILFGVKQFHISSQLASVNQVAALSHLLVRQQTNLFSILLVNNANTEKLVENLENLTKEYFVLDASLYATNGALLAQSHKNLNLRKQLGLGEPTEANQQIVEPIYSSNGIEGFLRVSFDTSYGQTTQSKINQIFNRLYGEFIVVFLVGLILASSIHYFLSQYRRYKVLNLEFAPSKKTRDNTVSNYHRRRRRFR